MNREVMQQALDALEDSVPDSSELVGDYIAKFGECYRPERLAAMRKTVADGEAAIAALRAELAKPDHKEPLTLRTDGYGVYKEKGKRLVDANGNFVAYLMSDEVASELIDPYHWSQPSQNCNRHPAAPHGADIEASFRSGHTVCKCASWSTGESS